MLSGFVQVARKEDSAVQVADGLYLGSILAAWDVDDLKMAGISHVLDISRREYHRHEDMFTCESS